MVTVMGLGLGEAVLDRMDGVEVAALIDHFSKTSKCVLGVTS